MPIYQTSMGTTIFNSSIEKWVFLRFQKNISSSFLINLRASRIWMLLVTDSPLIGYYNVFYTAKVAHSTKVEAYIRSKVSEEF